MAIGGWVETERDAGPTGYLVVEKNGGQPCLVGHDQAEIVGIQNTLLLEQSINPSMEAQAG